MIKDKMRFGELIDPLMKRFKALTKDQADVYYTRLRFSDEGTLEEAVETLVDTAKTFPSPGDIKIACRDVSYKKAKEGRSPQQGKGCPHCYDGYVFYNKPASEKITFYAGDCAYCHKGEVTIQSQLVQRNNEIYFACEQYHDGGTVRYRASPDIQDLYQEAAPIRTDRELDDRFHDRGLRLIQGGI